MKKQLMMLLGLALPALWVTAQEQAITHYCPADTTQTTRWKGKGTLGEQCGAMAIYPTAAHSSHKNHPELANKELIGVRLTHQLVNDVSDFKVFIIGDDAGNSYGQPYAPDRTRQRIREANLTMVNGCGEVYFDEPLLIKPTSHYFVCYSFKVDQLTDSTKAPFSMYPAPTLSLAGSFKCAGVNLDDKDTWWGWQGEEGTDHDLAFPLVAILREPAPKPEPPADPNVFSRAYFDEEPVYRGKGVTGEYRGAMAMLTDSAKVKTCVGHPELIGKQIVGIQLDKIVTDAAIKDYTVYLINVNAAEKDANPDRESRFIERVPIEIDNGTGVGYFKHPVKLTRGANFYAGYSFNVTEVNDRTKAPFALLTAKPNSWGGMFWVDGVTNKSAGNTWWGYSHDTTTGDELCHPIKVLLKDGDPEYQAEDFNLSVDSVIGKVSDFASDSVSVKLLLTNNGYQMAENVDYSYTLDGQAMKGYYNLKAPVSPRYASEVTIKLAPITEVGTHQITLNIDKINGQPNQAEEKTISFEATSLKNTDQIPEGAYEFSYCPEEFKRSYLAFGNVWPEHYDGAIKLADIYLKGLKIVGIKVPRLKADNISRISAFASKNLPVESPTDAENGVIGRIREDSTMVVAFNEPIEYNGLGMYVGFSMDLKDKTNWMMIPVGLGTVVDDLGLIVRNRPDETYWLNWGKSLKETLDMTVYLTGDGIKPNSLLPRKAITDALIAPGDTARQKIQFYNYGGNEISSFEYSYTAEGKDYTITKTLDKPLSKLLGVPQIVEIEIPGFSTPGSYDVTISFDKVNGEKNAFKKIVLQDVVSVAAFKPTHRPLMEEATGTECGYCPRGMIAMHEMAKKYPDFIAAAYHRYTTVDPMYTPVPEPWEVSRYPACTIDRAIDCDPFLGTAKKVMGIEADYLAARELLAPANLDLETSWNETQDTLSVISKSRFAFTENGKTYTLGYILTIDGLSHPDEKAWSQANYFKGDTSNVYYQALGDGSFDLSVFNHVILDASTYKGITNSLPAKPEVNTLYEHTYSFPLKSNKLFEDPDEVKVIAILLDNNGIVRNARVVQAGEATVPDSIESGILSPITDNYSAPEYFDLQGRRVANPGHGIFIMRHGNVTTKVVK